MNYRVVPGNDINGAPTGEYWVVDLSDENETNWISGFASREEAERKIEELERAE